MTDNQAARIERREAQEVLDGLYQCAFLGLLLYPLWLYLDIVQALGRPSLVLVATAFGDQVKEAWKGDAVFKDQLTWSLVVRGGIVALMGAYMRLSSYMRVNSVKDRSGTLIFLGALAQAALGIGVVALIVNLEAFEGNYFCGLIMVFIVIAILTPWKPQFTLIQVSSLTLVYIGAVFLYHHHMMRPVPEAVYTNLLFITAGAVLCCFGSFKTYDLHTRLRDLVGESGEPREVPRKTTSTFAFAPGTTRLEAVLRRAVFVAAILTVPLLVLVAIVKRTSQ